MVSAASDGLIKLWTLKSSECVATMDAHQARVWALAGKLLQLNAGVKDLFLYLLIFYFSQER